MSPFLSDYDYESATLQHWISREPDADEITVTVRSGGEMIRFVLLRPEDAAVTLTPCEDREVLPVS